MPESEVHSESSCIMARYSYTHVTLVAPPGVFILVLIPQPSPPFSALQLAAPSESYIILLARS